MSPQEHRADRIKAWARKIERKPGRSTRSVYEGWRVLADGRFLVDLNRNGARVSVEITPAGRSVWPS